MQNKGSKNSRSKGHLIFGFYLVSDFPFASSFTPADSEQALQMGYPEVLFEDVSKPPVEINGLSPSYVSKNVDHEGNHLFQVFRLHQFDVLRYIDVGDYYLTSDKILFYSEINPPKHLIELRFLGPVISYFLETRNILTIHASSVAVSNKSAIAFLANNHGGKTSLAAELMKTGYSLVSDDILAVVARDGDFYCLPGYPTMRMWPDLANYCLGSYEDLPIVHPALSKRRVRVGEGFFGTYRNELIPLSCIYLPKRQTELDNGDGIYIHPISPSNAVVELLRNSFSARVLEGIGLASKRFEQISHLVSKIPVRQLEYKTGFGQLQSVCKAIIADASHS